MASSGPTPTDTTLIKLAARAGIKRIRDLLAAGKDHGPELESLTSRAKDILTGRNVGNAGSQLRVLGHGSEGVAQHVLTPQGMKVTKVYDQHGPAFSEQLLANKDKLVGKQIPGFATIENKLNLNAPAHSIEYVPGRGLTRQEWKNNVTAPHHEMATQAHPDLELTDLNSSNFKMTPQGQVKAIDYVAAPKSDMLPQNQRGAKGVLHEQLDPYSQSYQSMRGAQADYSHPMSMPENASASQINKAQGAYRGNVLNRAYSNKPSQPLPQPSNQSATPVMRRPSAPINEGATPVMRRPAPAPSEAATPVLRNRPPV